MPENNHISAEKLLDFKRDNLNILEKEKLLEHIASCDFCADQLAHCIEEDLIQAPQDMKQTLMKVIKRPDVKIAMKAKELSGRAQLIIYSLKVGTAVIGALAVLFLTTKINFNSVRNSSQDLNMQIHKKFTITQTLRENTNSISNSMLEFSNYIMKTEVKEHDKKEK